MKALPLVLLVAAACADDAAPATEAAVIPINPWEPIDPGFIGCEAH